MDVGRRKTKCGDGYYGGTLMRVCGVRGREQESTFGLIGEYRHMKNIEYTKGKQVLAMTLITWAVIESDFISLFMPNQMLTFGIGSVIRGLRNIRGMR